METQAHIRKSDKYQHIRQRENAQNRQQNRKELHHAKPPSEISRTSDDSEADQVQIPAGPQCLHKVRHIDILQRIHQRNVVTQKSGQRDSTRPDRRIELKERLRLLHLEFQPPQNDQTELINDQSLNHAQQNHGDDINPQEIIHVEDRFHRFHHAGGIRACCRTCHHALRTVDLLHGVDHHLLHFLHLGLQIDSEQRSQHDAAQDVRKCRQNHHQE